MDLEHLNKKQIVLLTLLVSFMTSIATGIVTVSLMAQVPPPVTQTINRVVERTLERVVEKKTDEKGNVTTKEKTVVVKETDLISAAVQAALPSLASVYVIEHAPATAPVAKDTSAKDVGTASPGQTAATADALKDTAKGSVTEGAAITTDPDVTGIKGGKSVRTFVARGVFMSDATIVTDAGVIPDGAELEVVTSTSRATLTVKNITKKGALATLVVAPKSGVALQRGDAQTLALGNTLVALGGEDRVQVATGVIRDIDRNEVKKVVGISLDAAGVTPGGALVNLEGHLVAIRAGAGWVLQ